MKLFITLTKDVPDIPTAQALTEIVKAKLEDHPEVVITAQISESIPVEPAP